MSAAKKKPIKEVLPVAQQIISKLSAYCDRIEVAGSLRRGRPMIGDIEIVALAKPIRDLFNNAGDTSELDYFFANRKVPMIKNGAKYKQFKYGGFTVDMFLPESAAHWGCIFLIRTGSHEFNQWLMTEAQHRAGVLFRGGRLIKEGVPLDTPEEADVLGALGLPWIAPAYRDDNKWLELVPELAI